MNEYSSKQLAQGINTTDAYMANRGFEELAEYWFEEWVPEIVDEAEWDIDDAQDSFEDFMEDYEIDMWSPSLIKRWILEYGICLIYGVDDYGFDWIGLEIE